jgi:hypothetical protein
MKCVAISACQTRLDGSGKIRFFNPGEVGEFKKCPSNFQSLEEEYELDFLRATEVELMSSTWAFAEAAAVIKEVFDHELTQPEAGEAGAKANVVAQIIDVRFRNADTQHLTQNNG